MSEQAPQPVDDTNRRTAARPLEQTGASTTATFWPRGAIRAVSALVLGVVLMVGGYMLGIPVASGIAVIVGGLFFLLAASTLAIETRKRFGRKPSP